jgi:hypothetical protein
MFKTLERHKPGPAYATTTRSLVAVGFKTIGCFRSVNMQLAAIWNKNRRDISE